MPPRPPCSTSSCRRARSSTVAEAVIRVFHRLGDYKHKQRNRLKFLIKRAGLGRAGARSSRRSCEAFRGEGGAPLPFDPDHAAGGSRAGLAAATCRRRSRRSRRARRAAEVRGPGIVPRASRPVAAAVRYDFAVGARRTCARRSQPGLLAGRRSTIAARRPHRRAVAHPRPISPLAYGDGTVRITADQDLVFRWVRAQDVPELYARLAAAGLGLAGANTVADVDELPGRGVLPAGRDPVARAGPAARRHSARAARPRGRRPRPRHQDQRLPERLRPAPHRRHRLPGQRAQGRRQARCRSTSSGGRRRGRPGRALRAAGGQDPGAAHRRRGGAADRALPHDAARRARRRPRSSAAWISTR